MHLCSLFIIVARNWGQGHTDRDLKMSSFKWLVESIFMPLISLFGLAGNVFSVFVLRDKDVKLRR